MAADFLDYHAVRPLQFVISVDVVLHAQLIQYYARERKYISIVSEPSAQDEVSAQTHT